MAETGPGDAGGYVAFISYSHKDAAMGRWLHRKLEGYRLPKRLAGTQGEHGEVPGRLTPIFRDRDDLPAAGDLSEKVRAALAVSRNLIVVCSPNSAASPWVAKEIASFRELHPDGPILTAIVEGEPAQCFAPALQEGGAEPLAADLRKEGDGRRLGLLKLVAGIAGVGLDTLVQRDATRRIRLVSYVTAGAVAAMLLMGLLTAYALNARAEAQRQRAQAESLVEFMLTDLRNGLKGVASLSVRMAANRRALEYYQNQDLEGLPAESLERRARILHAIGEDELTLGQTERAIANFREAARTTAELLAEDPNNPDRIYAQAQSEFWAGYVDYNKGNFSAVKPPFQRYKALAARLVAIDPNNPRWRKEAGYSEGNLCTIALSQPINASEALRACTVALQHMEAAAMALGDGSLADELQNRHAWMADAWKANGNWTKAREHRSIQEKILRRMRAEKPDDLVVREIWILFQIAMADLYLSDHSPSWSPRQLDEVSAELDAMIALDPQNKAWAQRRLDLRERIRKIKVANQGRITS